jgi:16S rRNA (cytosine967-C5)-methyltransferase
MKPARPPATARAAALHVLLDCRRHDAFVQELLDNHLSRVALSANDRALTTQLVYGVLRRRGTLDFLLRPLVSRPPHQVEPWLWDALRLGAYQLLLLSQIPAYAAINETVELAALWRRPKAKGFLNGVLRALLALVTPDDEGAPAADHLPLEHGQYRRLAQAVLPPPREQPVEYLAAAFALPRWLAARWHARFGWPACLDLGFWFAGPAPLWLRVNPLKTDRPTFLAELARVNVAAEPGPHPQAVRLLQPLPIRDVPGYDAGWFAVQDISATGVAAALTPAPGSSVLDLCAAPGGKTSHLAELMQNQGRITACDVDDDRLRTVTTLCQRLGVTIVETRRLDTARNEEPPAGPFDAALVDVPCSNTGVLGRRPEVRWRLRQEDISHLVTLQTKLLILALERVRPGGTVVYSTCSMEPEENGGVVRTVLSALREWRLEEEQEALPGRPGDGGYWARLLRQSVSERGQAG